MAYRQAEYWYSWDGVTPKSTDWIDRLGADTGLHPPGSLLARYLGARITTPCTCSTIVRRDAIDRHGGFEDSFRLIFTDQAFYVKQALHSSIAIVDGHGSRYRQHANSACYTIKRQGTHDEARLTFLNWSADYLSEQPGVPDGVLDVIQTEVTRSRRRIVYARYPILRLVPAAWERASRLRGKISDRLGLGGRLAE